MSRDRPVLRGARCVALDHRPGAPARYPHEINLISAAQQPQVAERVSEEVRMNPEAGLLRSATNQLANARRTQSAFP